jgi:sensor domain CHASE-containing protein
MLLLLLLMMVEMAELRGQLRNSALLIGVFNGAFFIDSTGKPTFSNNVVASQATSKDYNTGSNDIISFR